MFGLMGLDLQQFNNLTITFTITANNFQQLQSISSQQFNKFVPKYRSIEHHTHHSIFLDVDSFCKKFWY